MSGDVWTDFVGTLKGYVRLGLTGPRLKNSGGNLVVRNPGDSADAVVLPQSLGTGTRDGTKYLRDDGTWQVVSGGGAATEHDAGNSGSSLSIDFANGKLQKVTLTANTTLTIAAPSSVGHYQLRLVQDATGGRSLAFSGLSATRWIGATSQPSHNTDANGETLVTLYYDGAAWTQGMSALNSAASGYATVDYVDSEIAGIAAWTTVALHQSVGTGNDVTVSGLPAGWQEILVRVTGLSFGATANQPVLQFVTASGNVETGYDTTLATNTSMLTTTTNGFPLFWSSVAAGEFIKGAIRISRVGTLFFQTDAHTGSAVRHCMVQGDVTLSEEATGLRLKASGSVVFDGGYISVFAR